MSIFYLASGFHVYFHEVIFIIWEIWSPEGLLVLDHGQPLVHVVPALIPRTLETISSWASFIWHQVFMFTIVENKHEGVRYPCLHCVYPVTTASDMKRRVQNIHGGVRYPCSQCELLQCQQVFWIHKRVRYPCPLKKNAET